MVTIATATLDDFDALDAIYQKSLSTYQHVKSTEELDYIQDLHLTQGNVGLNSNYNATFIAKDENKYLGFVTIIQEGPWLYHLTKIYVIADYQNKGIGTALFKHCIEHIKERHHNCHIDLELNVHRKNMGAKFYLHNGMKKVRDNIITLDNNFTFVQDVYSIGIECQ